MDLHREPHRQRRGVPPRRVEALEGGVLCGLVIEVKRLRIELRREALDVGFRDVSLPALEAHAHLEILEPLDHRVLRLSATMRRCRPGAAELRARPDLSLRSA